MKPYVDIQGAGENLTRIVALGAPDANAGTVTGASEAELRSLTVENIGASTYAVAIYNSGASVQLSDLTVLAHGGDVNYGVLNEAAATTLTQVAVDVFDGQISHGVSSSSSTITLTQVTVTATCVVRTFWCSSFGIQNNSTTATLTQVVTGAAGGGVGSRAAAVDNDNSQVTMRDVIAQATTSPFASSHGVYNYDTSATLTDVTAVGLGSNNQSYGVSNVSETGTHTVRIDRSTLVGGYYSLLDGEGYTTRVGASHLDGAVQSAGNTGCAGVYDRSYVFWANTCP
jgi:hypothetical protein